MAHVVFSGVGAAGGVARDGLGDAVVGVVISVSGGALGDGLALGVGAGLEGLAGEAVVVVVAHQCAADAGALAGFSGPGFVLGGDVACGVVLPAELDEHLIFLHGGGLKEGAVGQPAEGVISVVGGLAVAGGHQDGASGFVVAVKGGAPAFGDGGGAVVVKGHAACGKDRLHGQKQRRQREEGAWDMRCLQRLSHLSPTICWLRKF